ncbi:gas vesicle accessory protein GvpU [Lysinibacillus xylanilyticus]|uniref:gas vesicle accessory protein GvpU n=1 Tax=Lysinibacillus xylanilyticus TaxID=582475 RepID=UPI003D0692A5
MAEELHIEEKHGFDNKDGILATFVEITNETSIEIGLTLNVGGALISGLAVSYEKYLKGISELFKGHGPGAEAFSKQFEDLAVESKKYAETKEVKSLPNYIHMENTKFIDAHGNIQELGYWRGKLTSIDGFIIGNK